MRKFCRWMFALAAGLAAGYLVYLHGDLIGAPAYELTSTADTLYLETIHSIYTPTFRSMLSFMSSEALFHVTRSAVLLDFREKVEEGYPVSLAGNLILEIDTTTSIIVTAIPERVSVGSPIDERIGGYTEGSREVSFNIVLSTGGLIERVYELKSTQRSFFTIDSPPSPDDYPTLFEIADTDVPAEEENLITFSQTTFHSETTHVEFRDWITLSLVGGEDFWGETGDSITVREVTFTHRVGSRFLIPEDWESRASNPPPETDLDMCDMGGASFPYELVDQIIPNIDYIYDITSDTLDHYEEIFVHIVPDTTFENRESHQGYVYLIPIAGPLLDSLVVGSTPTLGEVAWSTVDAVLMYGGYRYAKWCIGRTRVGQYTDDAYRALTRVGTPADDLVQRTATSRLRNIVGDYIPGTDIHHVVAWSDRRATLARQILAETGITEELNLVCLSPSIHARLHTNAYFQWVTRTLANARGSESEVLQALTYLKETLSSGVLPF